jgi:hypothetical protein
MLYHVSQKLEVILEFVNILQCDYFLQTIQQFLKNDNLYLFSGFTTVITDICFLEAVIKCMKT